MPPTMPPPSAFLRRIAITAGLAAFLYQFESCLIITALPVMARDVPGLAGVISLVPAAYLVAALVAIVPAGRLAAQRGHHLVLASALGAMILGSVMCWFSFGVVSLLLGRLLQGLGGGALASAAYGLVAVCVPPDERRGVLGWISLGAGLGMMAGTPLGGLVAGTFSWRMLFALQVPLLFVVALVMLRKDFGQRGGSDIVLGLARSLLLGAGAGSASVATSLGRETGWFSPLILTLLGAAVLLLAGFVWSEHKGVRPLFPIEVWRSRAFWPWWGLLFACEAALGGLHFLLPFYLNEVGGMSIPSAARWMVIEVACYSITALNARRLQGIFSTEIQALTGVGLTLAGTALIASGLAMKNGPVGLAVSFVLAGVGFGLAFPAVSAGCVARLPEALRGLGASLLPIAINLGFMSGTIATAELREWHLEVEPPAVNYGQAFVVVLGALVIAGAGFCQANRAKSQP